MLSQFVKLHNGVEIPRIGLGTWQSQGDQCLTAVNNAIDAGYNLIDTASYYKNEDIIGGVIDKKPAQPNASSFPTANKKGIFVTSKAGSFEMGYNEVYDACLRTLKRLNVEQIDLYLLHWPGSDKLNDRDPQQQTTRLESWKAMERIYKEKKARCIGVSNYLVPHLEHLLNSGVEVVPHLNQLEVHPLCQVVDVRNYAKSKNIAIQAYSSLGTGSPDLLNNPIVLKVAEQEKMPVADVLLLWALQQDMLIIPKSTKAHNIQNNLKLLNRRISNESITELNSLQPCPDKYRRFCWDPMRII